MHKTWSSKTNEKAIGLHKVYSLVFDLLVLDNIYISNHTVPHFTHQITLLNYCIYCICMLYIGQNDLLFCSLYAHK